MTYDPYQASGGTSDPGNWNRYLYALNDPIDRNDPSGLTSCDANGDNCYDSVDVTDNENNSDVAYGYASTVSRQSFYTLLGRDRAYLIHAGGILISRNSISPKCQGGMTALGVDFDGLAIAAGLVDIQNGATANASIASAFGSAQLGASAQAQYDKQYASYLQANGQQHLTIAGYFAATGNTAAWTPFGGNTVFINPSLLNTSNLNVDQGLMLHEMLHEAYGLDDRDIMKTLAGYDPGAGINPAGFSEQITNWMVKNCVTGKGNN